MSSELRGTTSSALEVKVETLDIGEVSRKLGLSTATLRFYEEEGLIESVGRRGLRRLYAKSVVERLTLIGLGRAAGFSLKEIERDHGATWDPAIFERLESANYARIEDGFVRLMDKGWPLLDEIAADLLARATLTPRKSISA